jgi:glyoxylase-like metal-dependent hydrolase (beta-lactamase superfamily II)
MSEIEGLHRIELGPVQAYVLETPEGRVLVDTGYPDTAEELASALEGIGTPDLLILTHSHLDHVGGVPAVGDVTIAAFGGDADLLEQGETSRGLTPLEHCPPHLREVAPMKPKVDPVKIDVRLTDGEAVPGFPSLKVLHTPGHTEGHISLLWDHAGGVLIVGDAAANFGQVVPPPLAEDIPLTLETAAKLGELDFESAAFGHGPPITSGASAAFRQSFAAAAS